MAALQKIRSKSKLLIGVLAVALLAFIIPWNEVTSFINRSRDKAFSVDGEVVSTGAYQTRVTQLENFQRLLSGSGSLDENTIFQIREFVYEQMVKEIMLDEEATKLGLAVSDEEIRDLTFGTNISPVLQQNPLFVDSQTGQFNPQALHEFVSLVSTDVRSIPADQVQQRAQILELQDIWNMLLNTVKYQCLEEKYNALLAGTLLINDIEIKSAKENDNSAANIAYVVDRYSNIPDSAVTVTQKEIEELYSKRKNNFKNNTELRKISYFVKEIVPSESDFATVERSIEEAREKLAITDNPSLIVADYSDLPYNDIYVSEKYLTPGEVAFVKNSSVGETNNPLREGGAYHLYKLVDKVMAPDSVKLRMIVIPEGTDRLAANNRADSIINVIKQGKEFAQVANEVYPQSNGGDIGWVIESQLASAGKDFVDAVFKTPTGDITKLNIQGQIQILKSEQKTQPVAKYKIAHIQMPVVPSEQTLITIDNEINEFVANNSDGKNFVQAAKDKGYNLIENSIISGANAGIGQIKGSRQVINWAFNDKVGDVKKFDLSDYKIVAKIDSKISEGYFPISDTSDGLKAELIKSKKAEKIIADLKSQNITTLEGYAQALGTKVDTVNFVSFNTPNISGIGSEYTLNVYSELGKLNSLEGPVQGNNGVIVLDVLNRIQPKNFNEQMYLETINNQNMYRVMSQSIAALMNKMNVRDNRVKFF